MWAHRLGRLGVTGTTVVAALLLWAAPALAAGSDWKVGYYTPSGNALSMSSADRPAAGLATFNFTSEPNTALLATMKGSSKGSLLGDLRGKTITANFTISGATGAFVYWGEGTADNPCANPANTRLYFATDNGGGFAYTHYWWSNPSSAYLANGTATVTATVEPAEWSDWNGQGGLVEPAGFADAASNVTLIGLSFGGGCFFENGVGTSDGSGTFALNSYTVS
jgi:hypothetical protein